jgi:NADH:ubiquinone oxidoreductase subunit C
VSRSAGRVDSAASEIWIEPGDWSARARSLEEEGWRLTDLAGLDTIGLPGRGAFEVVAQLLHPRLKRRLMVHVPAPGEPPTVPSVSSVWPVADFPEREAFDMFGIRFLGHPNLTRILMPDDWEGYPLRKSYGVGKVAIEFIPQPMMQMQGAGQSPKPHEAETDVDGLGQSEEGGIGEHEAAMKRAPFARAGADDAGDRDPSAPDLMPAPKGKPRP